MRRGCSFIVPIAAFALTVEPVAGAEMTTYHYSGVVQSVSDDSAALLGSVVPGDAFSLAAIFDSGALDENPNSVWGSFASSGSPALPRLTLTLPAMTIAAPDVGAVIANDLAAPAPNPPMLDLFRLESTFDTVALGRHIVFFVQLLLIDDGAAAFGSDHLPPATPAAALFPAARQLIITGAVVGEPGEFTILASVDAPTPGAVTLVCIACAPVMFRSRR